MSFFRPNDATFDAHHATSVLNQNNHTTFNKLSRYVLVTRVTILFKNYDFVALYQKKPTRVSRLLPSRCSRLPFSRTNNLSFPLWWLFWPLLSFSRRAPSTVVSASSSSVISHPFLLRRMFSRLKFFFLSGLKKNLAPKQEEKKKKLETQRTLLCLVFPPGALPGRHTHTRAVVFPAGHRCEIGVCFKHR